MKDVIDLKAKDRGIPTFIVKEKHVKECPDNDDLVFYDKELETSDI